MNRKLANVTALYLEGIRDGNVRGAVEAYTGDRYTQHSTGVADGVEGFVHAYQDLNEGQARGRSHRRAPGQQRADPRRAPTQQR